MNVKYGNDTAMPSMVLDDPADENRDLNLYTNLLGTTVEGGVGEAREKTKR